jgi:hypothetical protein
MTEEDHQHKSPANLSHYRYIRVGQIEKYNLSNRIAQVTLTNGYITKNDDIIIMGRKSDTYIHQKAVNMKYQGKNVNKTPRGTRKNKISIELAVDGKVEGKGIDKLYIFTNKTYYKKDYSL